MAVHVKSRSPAKIQRPRLEHVHERSRLFEQLDRARQGPMVWIGAPAGAGKTTLAVSYLQARDIKPLWYQVDEGDRDLASFFYYLGLLARQAAPRRKQDLPLLTPEYHLGVPTFARNFFRAFFDRVKPPGVLVLDNFQNFGADSPIHALLPILLSEVPDGCTVFLLSRTEPPASLARSRTTKELAVLDWQSMRLVEGEAEKIAVAHGHRIEDSSEHAAAVQWMFEQSQGWAAGLVLLLEYAKDVLHAATPLSNFTPEVLFDYFSEEIFRNLESDTSEFLMQTACLPRVSVALARDLTGNPQAASLLRDLQRRNYFITRHTGPETSYQYHDLFREFLLAQAAEAYSDEQLAEMQMKAAILLRERKEYEDSVSLFLQAGAWKQAAAGVLGLAPQLLKQGRAHTLARWIAHMPPETTEQSPWLGYWLAICDARRKPSQAQQRLAAVFEHFRREQDVAGLYLTWSGMIDVTQYAGADQSVLDEWIEKLKGLEQRYPEFPSRDIEERVAASAISAYHLRRFDNPRRNYWNERARELFFTSQIPVNRLQLGAALIQSTSFEEGLQRSMQIVEVLEQIDRDSSADPVSRILSQAFTGNAFYFQGLLDEALERAKRALGLAEETGIHVFDPLVLGFGSYAALTQLDFARADNWLKRMEQQLASAPECWFHAFYHGALAWRASQQGDMAKAEQNTRLALEITQRVGVLYGESQCRYGLSLSMFKTGRFEEAHEELIRARQCLGGSWTNYVCALFESYFLYKQKSDAAANEYLSEALSLAAKYGFGRPPYMNETALATLATNALERGIEVDYVRIFIRNYHLLPPPDSPIPESWPLPVKVHTLGRFSLLREGKAVSLEGRAQRKPLELLKAVVALGGREVAESRLCDLLWPDTEADLARQNLKVVLHRLRRMIGSEAILLRGSKLSLDPRQVWVDGWTLERWIQNALQALQTDRCDMADVAAGRAFDLYGGAFLSGDEFSFVYGMRDRLRARILNLVTVLGQSLERREVWERALVLYRRGLEIDPLMESFYQGLIRAHRRLGQGAEAKKTYNRCREILGRELGIPPSSVTESLV